MVWQKQMQEQTAKEAAALHAAKEGNLSALTPYVGSHTIPTVRLNHEDAERERAIIAEKHLANEKSVSPAGQDPARTLQITKKWLSETFPPGRADALIVKDTEGRFYIAIVGLSAEEVGAAAQLTYRQKQAAKRSEKITTRIQERITHEQQKTVPTPTTDEAIATSTARHRQRQEPSSTTRTV
jgi:hypothetical protein